MKSEIDSNTSVEIFIAYAREDEAHLIRLIAHLKSLERQGFIKTWHDRCISPGMEWEGKIDEHLNSSKIILLLVSADFLASDYCYDVEVSRAIELHESGQAKIVPIILQPVIWEGVPFAKYEALPKGGQPVSTWTDSEVAYYEIAKGISTLASELTMQKNGTIPSSKRGKKIINGEDIKWRLVIAASFEALDYHSLPAFIDNLRKLTNDSNLTIIKLSYGSIIFDMLGSEHGYNKIVELVNDGIIGSILGMHIESVSLTEDIEKADDMSPQPVDKSMLLREVAGVEGILRLRGESTDLAFVDQILDSFCRILLTRYGLPYTESTIARDYGALRSLIRVASSLDNGIKDAPFMVPFVDDLYINGFTTHKILDIIDEVSTALLRRHAVSEELVFQVQGHLLKLYTLCRNVVSGETDEHTAELMKTLKLGEDQHTEFKSTLRINLRTGKPDKEMERVIVKSIAGFMNHEGGTLYIGISDDGKVLGIAEDLKTFKKKTNDAFERHLRQLLNQSIGLELSQFLNVRPFEFAGNTVFIIKVERSEKPVFVKSGDNEVLYVRIGASTRSLNTRQAFEYYQSRPLRTSTSELQRNGA